MEQATANRAPASDFLRLTKLWIWLSALASLAGWSLSAIGQLNRLGYGVFFFAAAVVFFLGRKKKGWLAGWSFPSPKKIRRRFRRPLPAAFALLALLVLAGGVMYAPSNYTGLNYHLARVLQWLAHGQWCWVHTPVNRINITGCAFEWLTTPLVLFTRSDRLLFLVNYLPFLLLPGLIFGAFTRLGVRARVAWHWMWLLPAGYVFLLQAGSIGNDAFSAFYALAAITFGCRVWESRRLEDWWVSLLAIALMTGTKAISLPLVLPWAVLTLPLFPWLRRHWLPTLPLAVLAGLVSFLPISLMNLRHAGDWLGKSLQTDQLEIRQPLIGIAGNAFQLLLDNVVPPVFPLAGWWNQHAPQFMPHAVIEAVNRNFEMGFFTIGELPTEDWAGIGFGLVLLLAASVLGSGLIRQTIPSTPLHLAVPLWLRRCVLVAAWLAMLAYSMKSGLTTAARLIAPYYLLLVPLLLVGAGQSQVVRRPWWRGLAGTSLCLALIALVVSPDRPLWPDKTILSRLAARHPEQNSLARALQIYTVFSERNDALAGVRALLPPDLKVVGFIGTGDDCDVSLWRPFGSRRVEHFLLTDPPEQIRRQVDYVVVGGANLGVEHVNFDAWRQAAGVELVATTNVIMKVSEGIQPWHVVRFKPQ